MTAAAPDTPTLRAEALGKRFTLHLRGGVTLSVIAGAGFAVQPGRCTVLDGPSGAGKSSLLKMIHGSYRIEAGRVEVPHRGRTVDLASASDRLWLELRRETIGYVSQFLRTVPRVAARDVVAAPLIERGESVAAAHRCADALLERLNLPRALWSLPPATFSGGERQRVNVARGFITPHRLLLLDEPTASLDAANRDVVIELVRERKADGTAILAIFHDAVVREALADASVDVRAFSPS